MNYVYNKIPTTLEVYRALYREHHKVLACFESYTDIVENGTSKIFTVWGIKGADVPMFGALSTYESEYGSELDGTRVNEYWLCLVKILED